MHAACLRDGKVWQTDWLLEQRIWKRSTQKEHDTAGACLLSNVASDRLYGMKKGESKRRIVKLKKKLATVKVAGPTDFFFYSLVVSQNENEGFQFFNFRGLEYISLTP